MSSHILPISYPTKFLFCHLRMFLNFSINLRYANLAVSGFWYVTFKIEMPIVKQCGYALLISYLINLYHYDQLFKLFLDIRWPISFVSVLYVCHAGVHLYMLISCLQTSLLMRGLRESIYIRIFQASSAAQGQLIGSIPITVMMNVSLVYKWRASSL